MNNFMIDRYEFTSVKFGTYYVEFYQPGVAKVQLLSFTDRPTWTIATAVRGYTGRYENIPLEQEEVTKLLKDISMTKNQTPLEMVSMFWLLEDVSRAFTHQLVRYRVGTSFVQESMRFVGMQNTYKILATHLAGDNLQIYMRDCCTAIQSYVMLLDRGTPPEDARGIIPTNILTKIFFNVNLRALQNIFPNRLCCQAQQGEWQPILRSMREQIKFCMGDEIEQLLRAPYELGQPCGFRASFDRPCIWQKEKEYDNNTGV